MKLKNIIASVLLTLGVGISVVTGFSLYSGNGKNIVETQAAELASPNGKRTILANNKHNYSTVYCYLFDDKGNYEKAWPGTAMTKVTNVTNDNYPIWRYDIPVGKYTKVIFNNGSGQQSANIPLSGFTGNNNIAWFDNSSNGSYGYFAKTGTGIQGKVTYNANGGSGTTSPKSYYFGQRFTVGTNGFSRSGYSFDSWNTKSDGTGTKYSPGDTFYTSSSSPTLYAQWTQTTYKVTEYAVYDGVVDNNPIKTSSQASSYVPTQDSVKGYVSKGIFLDAEGTTLYPNNLSKETTLYHIYESEKIDYIYLSGLDDDKWGNSYQGTVEEPKQVRTVKLYTWNSETNNIFNGEYPGSAIEYADYVAPGINFAGRGLYRFEFVSNAVEPVTHFIISTSGTEAFGKSADLKITYGAYYDMNHLLEGVSADKCSGDLTLGAQAELVWEINEAILSSKPYDFDGKTYTHSLCSVELSTITSLLSKYDALEVKTEFDKTTFWVNNANNKETGDQTKLSADYFGIEIIAQMRELSLNGALSMNKLLGITKENAGQNLFIIIISITSMTVIAICLFIKKKKTNQ